MASARRKRKGDKEKSMTTKGDTYCKKMLTILDWKGNGASVRTVESLEGVRTNGGTKKIFTI